MADTTIPQPIAETQKKTNPFVNYFALCVTVLCALVLLTLLGMAWLNIANKDVNNSTFDNIKTLFNILLPVVGTWMGTMLAFYFSKDNFEAANEQAKTLVNQMNPDQGNQQLSVADIMVKPNESALLMRDSMDAFKKTSLSELIQTMEESHSDRLPILEKETLKFLFLIYRTTIERFQAAIATSSVKVNKETVSPTDISTLTMQAMFDSDFDLFNKIKDQKACFLPINATMDKVKQAMQDNTICQDVFITQTGSSDEKVEGWITNLMVIEKSSLFKKAALN
ncbi:MAG TPA: hypothetical protein VK671_15125 [Mucilaginibacter sp.]|jgi:hypothetical protein|nr:hypothetical protein [Mucilaginibacter sp.]